MSKKPKKVETAVTPLQLAHAKRKEQSKRVAAMTPMQRTAELAPAIVSAAIGAIKKVGILGSAKTVRETGEGNVYELKFALSPEQKGRILAALRHEVDQLDARLTPGEGATKKKTAFSF